MRCFKALFRTIVNTSSNFGGKVFVANACVCRRQIFTVMCGATAFTRAPKPDFRPNMAGAPCEQIAQNILHERSLSLQNYPQVS